MKSLLILSVFFVVVQSAFAASFTTVPSLTDERLMRLSDIHEDLAHIYDNCSTRGFLQIAARRLNEKWENTVKQAVYYTNTGVNAPVGGVRAQALDLKDENQMAQFIVGAFSHKAMDPAALSARDKRALNAFKALLGTLRGDFQFYTGGHENSFGPASYAVIVDLINAELLVIEADRCR